MHPLCTEAVNYITQRTELLFGLFFLVTLYLSLRAANRVENFHYRLRDERVLIHDVIHGGSTASSCSSSSSKTHTSSASRRSC